MSDATVTIRPGKLIIDGEARDAASGATFETWNPATETRITTVAEAGVEDVDLAVRAARLGFRLRDVAIPTVYGDETSHLSPTRDVPRIVGMMVRLTFEPRPRPRA